MFLSLKLNGQEGITVQYVAEEDWILSALLSGLLHVEPDDRQ